MIKPILVFNSFPVYSLGGHFYSPLASRNGCNLLNKFIEDFLFLLVDFTVIPDGLVEFPVGFFLKKWNSDMYSLGWFCLICSGSIFRVQNFQTAHCPQKATSSVFVLYGGRVHFF